MATGYTEIIRRHDSKHDPRHIEAFIRINHSTLDGLSERQFKAEVKVAAQYIEVGGVEFAERTARSFGL